MKWSARVAAVALLLSFPAAATLSLAPQSVRITSNDGSLIAGVTANGLAIQQTTAANLNATVVGNLTTNGAAPTATNIGVLPGIANAAAPTYTEGRQVLLSTDLTGALRITGSISATNPSVTTTGSAPPASATYIGGSVTTAAPSYTNGQLSGLSLDTSGNLRVAGSFSATVGSTPGTTTFNQATAITSTSAITCSASATVSVPTEMYQIAIHSADYWRCQIQYNNNGTPVNYGFCVTSPGSNTCVRTPPKGGWRQTAGAAGTQVWQATCTLFGQSVTPDLVCDSTYCTGSGC